MTVLRSIADAFRQPMPAPFRLKSYAVADLPEPAKWANGLISVPDESGGATIAFSDGTNWRRLTDLAIVS